MRTLDFILNIPDETKLVNLCTGMVHHASEFTSDITISTEGTVNHQRIDLKSILGVMSLVYASGKLVHIEISGEDEELAYMCLEKYTSRFKQ